MSEPDDSSIEVGFLNSGKSSGRLEVDVWGSVIDVCCVKQEDTTASLKKRMTAQRQYHVVIQPFAMRNDQCYRSQLQPKIFHYDTLYGNDRMRSSLQTPRTHTPLANSERACPLLPHLKKRAPLVFSNVYAQGRLLQEAHPLAAAFPRAPHPWLLACPHRWLLRCLRHHPVPCLHPPCPSRKGRHALVPPSTSHVGRKGGLRLRLHLGVC
jgi:hypothetical protein